LTGCRIYTNQAGGGAEYHLNQGGGTLAVDAATLYDTSKTNGTITNLAEDAADLAFENAIPGSPTADSINERIKAIDVLTEASGAGDLAAILADTGTDGVVIATATQQAITDELLKRAVQNVEDTADKHSLGALVMIGTNSSVSGTTLTAKKPSDDTTFQTYTLTVDASADPMTGIS
jgi:hypothetical protein